MQIQKKWIISIISSVVIFSTSAYAAVQEPVSNGEGFTAGEHVSLGDEIQLRSIPGNTRTIQLLTLHNGIKLTYGEIMSLGDFYGTPDLPVSYGKTRAEKERLFLAAFDGFSATQQVTKEVHKILDVTHEEQAAIATAISHGERLEDVYKRLSEDHSKRYNCITGGGCGDRWWLSQGRYLKLARTDYDHFGEHAVSAYEVGHALAIEQAIAARSEGNIQMLETAYAMNAFASHFLSDRFSTGHMRTPRRELDENATPAFVGSLLSHYMHDEESESGLRVHNTRGDHWAAFGDKHYFDDNSARHREMLREALQVSADEVNEAYINGMRRISSEVTRIIPLADSEGSKIGDDIAPMFYWDEEESKLMRRDNLANTHDFHFRSDWWGWSTFLELSSLHGMPHGLQK